MWTYSLGDHDNSSVLATYKIIPLLLLNIGYLDVRRLIESHSGDMETLWRDG